MNAIDWMNLDLQSLIDYAAIFALVLGSALYMARRFLAAVFLDLNARSRPALVPDRSEQSACSGCGIADRNRAG
jgi:hypothetical protein